MEAVERAVGVNGSAVERPQAADASELLHVRGVFKSFGGTEALADVGMTLKAGEILALLGENGAGKSTLIKILAGVYSLDAGQVSYRGLDVTHALRRLPIAFIHQDLGLIEWMTVAENISLMLGFPRRFGMIDRAAARRRAATALEALGADIDPDARVQNLTRTEKSLVAIARALAADAEILVLDEPTASLPADEVARLFTALRRLRAHGVGDDLRLAPSRRGVRDRRSHGHPARRTRRGGAGRWRDHAGRDDPAHRRPRTVAGVQAAARRERRRAAAARSSSSSPSTASVRSTAGCDAGEVVGFVGFAARARKASAARCSGCAGDRRTNPARRRQAISRSSPREAIASGINLVCADRVAESIVPGLSIRENLFLNPVAAGSAALSLAFAGHETRPPPSSANASACGPNDPLAADRVAVRRQPAEGRRSAAGCISTAASTCSRIRRPAWTSAPRRKSTGCSTSCSRAAPRF